MTSNDTTPGPRELRQLLKMINAFCDNPDLKDRPDIFELRQIVAPAVPRGEGVRRVSETELRQRYLDAVAVLVEIASPTSKRVFQEVLSDLNRALSSEETATWNQGPGPIEGCVVLDQETGENYNLTQRLPEPHPLTDEQKAAIEFFRGQLPEENFSTLSDRTRLEG